MAMTQKHYQKWASMLGAQKANIQDAPNAESMMNFTIDTFCQILKDDDPRFREDLFRKAIDHHYENALFTNEH